MQFIYRPRFPGAAQSQLVTNMEFLIPSSMPVIPTYRVMDADGNMEDGTRTRPDVSNEQALLWYKNMLTGRLTRDHFWNIRRVDFFFFDCS